MYVLRTVDVWDTLLRRDCHPEVIKRIVAEHVYSRFAADITREYATHSAVYSARLAAETQLAKRALARGYDDEYSLTDVMRCWLGILMPNAIAHEVIQQVSEYEYRTEVSHSLVDTGISDILDRFPASTTMFLSDFYWPGDLLQKLIEEKGLHGVVPKGITSCDVGLNKRSGRLYQYVINHFALSPESIIHVGDNRTSDYVAPRKLGIAAVHYSPQSSNQRRRDQSRRLCRPCIVCHDAEKELSVAAAARRQEPASKSYEVFNAGVDAAPLFIGFARYVAENALRNGVRRLFFLTREGVFLKRVFEAMFPENTCNGLSLPSLGILHASRRSTQPASFTNPTNEILDGRRWPYRRHTIRAMCTALGVHCKDVAAAISRASLHDCDVVVSPCVDERVHALVKDEEFINAVNTATWQRRELLIKYLEQSGLGCLGRYGVVDIGWRGTIQDNIAYALPKARLDGFYLAIKEQLSAPLSNARKYAYGVVEGESLRASRLLETYAFLEMLCASPHGSVVSYCATPASVTPVCESLDYDAAVFDSVIKPFQDGVVFACEAWRRHIERNGLTSNEIHTSAVAAWRRLSRTNVQALVDAFLATPLTDPYAEQSELLPSAMPRLSLLLRATHDRSAKNAVRDYVRRVQWRNAMRRTRERGVVTRTALWGLCVALSAYRHVSVVRRRFARNGQC